MGVASYQPSSNANTQKRHLIAHLKGNWGGGEAFLHVMVLFLKNE